MANINAIRENGANLIVYFDDGSRRIAVKNAIGLWTTGLAGVEPPTLSVGNISYDRARLSATVPPEFTVSEWFVQVASDEEFTNVVRSNTALPWLANRLQPNTGYYARALATYTNGGTVYSNIVNFTTTNQPPPDPDPDPKGFAWPFPPGEIGTEWWGYWGHMGVDWPRAGGTPILASNDGTVQYAGWTSAEQQWGLGNQVLLNHGAIGVGGAVLFTRYAHMNAQPVVAIGQTVTKGQVLGYVGTTGNSTGNHLHWETAVGGRWNQINPRDFMATYGE